MATMLDDDKSAVDELMAPIKNAYGWAKDKYNTNKQNKAIDSAGDEYELTPDIPIPADANPKKVNAVAGAVYDKTGKVVAQNTPLTEEQRLKDINTLHNRAGASWTDGLDFSGIKIPQANNQRVSHQRTGGGSPYRGNADPMAGFANYAGTITNSPDPLNSQLTQKMGKRNRDLLGLGN